MSDANLELIRRLYAAVDATRRIPREMVTADYELDASEISAEHPDPLVGVDAAESAVAAYWETFDDFHIELEEVLHADSDTVVTVIRDHGRIRGSDARVSNRYIHVFWFRDGKVARQALHRDRDRALRAAAKDSA